MPPDHRDHYELLDGRGDIRLPRVLAPGEARDALVGALRRSVPQTVGLRGPALKRQLATIRGRLDVSPTFAHVVKRPIKEVAAIIAALADAMEWDRYRTDGGSLSDRDFERRYRVLKSALRRQLIEWEIAVLDNQIASHPGVLGAAQHVEALQALRAELRALKRKLAKARPASPAERRAALRVVRDKRQPWGIRVRRGLTASYAWQYYTSLERLRAVASPLSTMTRTSPRHDSNGQVVAVAASPRPGRKPSVETILSAALIDALSESVELKALRAEELRVDDAKHRAFLRADAARAKRNARDLAVSLARELFPGEAETRSGQIRNREKQLRRSLARKANHL